MNSRSIFRVGLISRLAQIALVMVPILTVAQPAMAQSKSQVNPESELARVCRSAVKEKVFDMESRAEKVHVDLDTAIEWQQNEVETFVAGQGRIQRRSGNWRDYRFQCIYYLRTRSVTVVEINMGTENDWREESSEFGVTLYRDLSYRGTNETFTEDIRDLRGSRIGDDQTTSVRVSPGCMARLYRDPNFAGAYSEISADTADLRGSRVGDDSVTSMKMRCDGRSWDDDSWVDRGDDSDTDPWSKGVTLFRDLNFTDISETFASDNPDLRGSRIGDDQATSVKISVGCRARLYQDTNFRGRYTEVSADIPDLRRTEVGDDAISSLQIRCGN